MEELFRKLTEKDRNAVMLGRIDGDKALRFYAAVRFLSSLYGKKELEKKAESVIEKLKLLKGGSNGTESNGKN